LKGVFEDKDIEQENAQAETENADATEENVGCEKENIEATEKIAGTTLHDLPGEEASADVTEEAFGIAPESEGTVESLPIMAVWGAIRCRVLRLAVVSAGSFLHERPAAPGEVLNSEKIQLST